MSAYNHFTWNTDVWSWYKFQSLLCRSHSNSKWPLATVPLSQWNGHQLWNAHYHYVIYEMDVFFDISIDGSKKFLLMVVLFAHFHVGTWIFSYPTLILAGIFPKCHWNWFEISFETCAFQLFSLKLERSWWRTLPESKRLASEGPLCLKKGKWSRDWVSLGRHFSALPYSSPTVIWWVYFWLPVCQLRQSSLVLQQKCMSGNSKFEIQDELGVPSCQNYPFSPPVRSKFKVV